MGYRTSWVARSGNSTTELLGHAALESTGDRFEFPETGWHLLQVTDPRPFAILIANGSDYYGQLKAVDAKKLSRNGHETFYFSCIDEAMGTEISAYMDGVNVWTIRYISEQHKWEPEFLGSVPGVANDILSTLQAKQSGGKEHVDYVYDITADLGRCLVGFRHDEETDFGDPLPFRLLKEKVPPEPTRPWWKFWSRGFA